MARLIGTFCGWDRLWGEKNENKQNYKERNTKNVS